jgi:hypothetical protein
MNTMSNKWEGFRVGSKNCMCAGATEWLPSLRWWLSNQTGEVGYGVSLLTCLPLYMSRDSWVIKEIRYGTCDRGSVLGKGQRLFSCFGAHPASVGVTRSFPSALQVHSLKFAWIFIHHSSYSPLCVMCFVGLVIGLFLRRMTQHTETCVKLF